MSSTDWVVDAQLCKLREICRVSLIDLLCVLCWMAGRNGFQVAAEYQVCTAVYSQCTAVQGLWKLSIKYFKPRHVTTAVSGVHYSYMPEEGGRWSRVSRVTINWVVIKHSCYALLHTIVVVRVCYSYSRVASSEPSVKRGTARDAANLLPSLIQYLVLNINAGIKSGPRATGDLDLASWFGVATYVPVFL